MTTTRREFLKASAAVGGGLALEFSFAGAAAAQSGAPPVEVTHWLVIHPDERVSIRIAHSEMGQGSLTGLAQLVAEELDCDWKNVTTEFASPNEHLKRKRAWGSMATFGSTAIRNSQEYLRKAGATAREMLVGAAAAQWSVPASECSASVGVITHGPSKRTISYGKVATAASKVEPPKEVKLKDPKDWKIAGTSVKRLDSPDKVVGKPVFGVDVLLPDLLHASIVQSPVFLGKVKSVDSAAAEKLRGVKGIVREEGWVAVVADNWWRANQAAKKLAIQWDEGDNGSVTTESIFAMLRQGLDAKDLPTARAMGDAPAAIASAAKVVEAEYSSPYLAHATMEPQTATAWFKDGDRLEVWAPTQDGEGALKAAAEVSGLPVEKVEVHKTMLGGGFGRRAMPDDFVRQAVAIAKRFPGKPVKLIWSREEDMQHDFYRPASVVRLRAGLDAQGNVTALHAVIACPSILKLLVPFLLRDGIDRPAVRTLADNTYTIPNQRIEYAMRNPHVPVGFWRAPGQQNAFYRECFVDELAHAAGKDPLEFRLAMLKPEDKNRRVLEEVARAAKWGSPLPKGVFRGIAQADGMNSFSAMVSEVSIAADGRVKVHRVTVAIDSGYVVHPDACRAQAEGNIIFCMGQLSQGNTVKDGRIAESNFHDFPLPRLGDAPVVETVLVPSGGFWGGNGEIAAMAVAPSILNAVFAATGKRVRSLPLKDGKVA